MQNGSRFWLVDLTIIGVLAVSGGTSTRASAQEAGPSPATAIVPFDTAQAKTHQKAWADHLGVPVTSTNSIGMKLVVIPPGEFAMGSPVGEPERKDNETQHPVRLSKAFSIGVYEVTQSQYEEVMGSNPSQFRSPSNPVENVSWDDAVEFCQKLSGIPAEKSAGRVYRLPTEAEWEYACRAGTTTAYSFGDDKSQADQYAWFRDNSSGTTQAVGEKLPNGWGLYDMHSNVWEWCEDRYARYPSGAATDPRGPDKGSYRVQRGGGWFNVAARGRSASRDTSIPTYRSSMVGFRLALHHAD